MPALLSLQPLLRQPYSPDTYRTILQDILPNGALDLRQVPQAIVATCDFVKGTVQTGTIELPDGNSIALLEVEVSDQVKLARNRVALRNFVARFIDEASTTAVLAVFHQPGKPDWRLTYACKRSQIDDDTLEITSTQTAPRRYTFLLGQNEPCKTAAGRLAELREKGDQLALDDVEKAFSVERLNKEFFKEYKKHYETFVAHLLSPAHAKTTRAAFGVKRHLDPDEQSKADKPIRDFVKRLLGRFVFLHFLQKKGWMGCKAGSKAWSGGDPDFLASYFTLAEAKGEGDRFHSRWLIPLFFDALNNAERTGELFAPTGTRVPYLNGGLFETDPAPLQALDFPADHFRALLGFFGQYHFTIDENDPEDHEVGIDPEMLGHIFENLLEDNKDKGAYYTPKAIVAYMARQSLLHYLQTHLGEHEELGVLLNEKDFTRLEKDGFVHRNARRIEELLDEVKICDPAIGSGAFPIGLLQEILWTRLTLDLTLNTAEERAKLKRRIIQNSIHGVDLDPGAVEIARLRFWLALVVDEDQPRPLPNLDYKIHRADSLIEYIRGEPVHLGKVSTEDKRTNGAIQKLIEAKAQLFSAQKVPEKRAARFALYRALAEVAMAEFTWLRNEMGLFAKDAERAAQLDLGLKEFGHRIKLIDSVAKESARNQDRALAELRAWFDDEEKPTFLWQLHFGEVFERGGFDIVIGNPPYISVERFSRTLAQQYWRDRYVTFASRGDVYCFFYELALSILKPSGVTAYITSNKFQRAGYGTKLRDLLSSKRIHSAIDFCELPVFAAATDPMIIVVSNEAAPHGASTRTLVVKCEAEIRRLAMPSGPGFGLMLSSTFTSDIWNLEGAGAGALFGKLRKQGVPLGQFVGGHFYLGLRTGFNDAFVIEETTRSRLVAESPNSAELIKPWIRGRDIERWRHDPSGLYVIVFPFGFASELPKYPAIHRHLRRFETELKARGQCRSSRNGSSEGQHHWLELDNNPLPDYLSAFDTPSIVYADIGKHLKAFYSTDGVRFGNTAYFIPNAPRWMLALLLSTPYDFIYRNLMQPLGDPWTDGRLRFFSRSVKDIPIPDIAESHKTRLADLAQACAEAAQRGDDESLAVHEAEIDEIVYRLFDLTPDEISLIEAALAPTRPASSPRRRKASPTVSAASAPPVEPAAEHPPAAEPAASPSPWIPGELFAQEGDLPAQPRRPG